MPTVWVRLEYLLDRGCVYGGNATRACERPQGSVSCYTVNTTQAAWLAGFVDGEGCVTARLQKGKYLHVSVQIVQKDKAVLDHIAGMLGYGTISRFRSGVHVWRIHERSNLLAFIDVVLPYAIVKRAALEAARELTLTIREAGSPKFLPEGVRERRIELANLMRVRGEPFV